MKKHVHREVERCALSLLYEGDGWKRTETYLASRLPYRGSVNSSQVRVGEVLKSAVRRGATAVIVVHKHPSGDPTPSPDDIAVTRAFV